MANLALAPEDDFDAPLQNSESKDKTDCLDVDYESQIELGMSSPWPGINGKQIKRKHHTEEER